MKRDTLAKFSQVAEQYSASIAIDYRSRHAVLIVVPSNGQDFFFPIPNKVDRGEERVLQNSLADLRRQLRMRERYSANLKPRKRLK